MTPEKPPDTKHVIESNQELLTSEHPQVELLRWHHSLGHLAFIKIRILSLLGIISKRLANTKPPKYEGCIYGTKTNSPLHTKGRQANAIQMLTVGGPAQFLERFKNQPKITKLGIIVELAV